MSDGEKRDKMATACMLPRPSLMMQMQNTMRNINTIIPWIIGKVLVSLFKKANGKECNTVDPCQWVHGKQNLSSGRIG